MRGTEGRRVGIIGASLFCERIRMTASSEQDEIAAALEKSARHASKSVASTETANLFRP